ncbi:MAG: aldehyde ferredoxin oxidoreductase family protein [Candidatus Thorarchaeota archaeon]
MGNGCFDRVLNIDVSNRSYEIEDLEADLTDQYLGGKGLATHLLLERNPIGVDPFSPENLFIIGIGPVTDSPIYGSCRYGIFTKSPLTGFYGESYSGGRVARHMSRTGYDAVIIKGASDKPVWLEITSNNVVFHDGKDLWGQETYAAEDMVKDHVSGSEVGVIVIGPAGENLIRYAVVENEYWRSAGRCGMGAVLGSKKIKAVAFHGEEKRPFADPKGMKAFSRDIVRKFKNHPAAESYRTLGTPALVALNNEAGSFPTQYWSKGRLRNWEKISADTFRRRFKPRPRACAACFMACGKYIEISDGPYQGLKLEGPEYETIYAFGGLCCIDRIEDIAYLNDLCDRLGLDTITAGNVAAFAIEASQQGKFPVSLNYGNSEQVINLIKKIASREGVGNILAEGVRRASEAFGLEEIAVHVKGMEPAGYDPRVLKGMGLAYAVSDRGACHLRATFYKPELSGLVPPGEIKGKAELFLDYEDRCTLFDTLIVCRFYRDFYLWDELSQIIGLATGLLFNKSRLRRLAARVTDMTRQFNIREGLMPADDFLPHRLLTESLEGGHRIRRKELQTLIRDYYHLRGWEIRDGNPTHGPALK